MITKDDFPNTVHRRDKCLFTSSWHSKPMTSNRYHEFILPNSSMVVTSASSSNMCFVLASFYKFRSHHEIRKNVLQEIYWMIKLWLYNGLIEAVACWSLGYIKLTPLKTSVVSLRVLLYFLLKCAITLLHKVLTLYDIIREHFQMTPWNSWTARHFYASMMKHCNEIAIYIGILCMVNKIRQN